jgi:hypothetical protein
MLICSVPDCKRPVLARGWCQKHWQRWYRTGSPADPGPRVVSSETRQKLSDAFKGKVPAKAIAASNIVWRGRKHSGEAKAKMSKAKKGGTLTEEHKRKVGEALKGRRPSDSAIANAAAAKRIPAGSRIAYMTAHHRHHKLLPTDCLHCGRKPGKRRFPCALQQGVPESDLLFDAGRAYSPNEDHYIRLCLRCHSRYDHAHPSRNRKVEGV